MSAADFIFQNAHCNISGPSSSSLTLSLTFQKIDTITFPCTEQAVFFHCNGSDTMWLLRLDIKGNVDGPRGYYAQWNKPDKDKYFMISLTCRI